MTLTRSQIRSPAPKNKSRAVANLTKSGRRPGAAAGRRVLGDRNDSVIRGNNTPAAFNPALTSIDSVSFFKVGGMTMGYLLSPPLLLL